MLLGAFYATDQKISSLYCASPLSPQKLLPRKNIYTAERVALFVSQ